MLFLKVLTDPNKKVQRLIYPENKVVMMVSSIPNVLDGLSAGTFLFSKPGADWELSLLLIKNKQPELKEINIAHISGLENALCQASDPRSPAVRTGRTSWSKKGPASLSKSSSTACRPGPTVIGTASSERCDFSKECKASADAGWPRSFRAHGCSMLTADPASDCANGTSSA